jgi:UDP-N-acetylglucosamine:LPS N-acetylglucosamine transferase
MKTAWVVGATMGYGHARAAMPLVSIAEGGVALNANDYDDIPESDRKTWGELEFFYNKISRLSSKGPLGRFIFALYDRAQRINPLVPGKNEVKATPQLKQLYAIIRGGWGKHLIETLAKKPLPLVATFFTPGHMAEYWKYPGPIYILGTDSDLSRAWAPLEPATSAIRYFAPTDTAARHLESYGIPKENVILTGFPLPLELTRHARQNFEERLARLAARGGQTKRPITLTFAVGGAGAQLRIGDELSMSLSKLIHQGRVNLNLVAGTNEVAKNEFTMVVHQAHLAHFLGGRIRIIYTKTKDEYFREFNEALATTDLLWTKPSEISFYAALGIPIIIAPPVGAQERCNRNWLLGLEAGTDEGDPKTAREWLPELLVNGSFAAMAQNGYDRMEREGTTNIMQYLNAHHR